MNQKTYEQTKLFHTVEFKQRLVDLLDVNNGETVEDVDYYWVDDQVAMWIEEIKTYLGMDNFTDDEIEDVLFQNGFDAQNAVKTLEQMVW